MRYSKIRDDLGGPGFGKRFKRILEIVAAELGRTASDLWDEIEDGVKEAYPNLYGDRLAIAAMTWFLDGCIKRGYVLDDQ